MPDDLNSDILLFEEEGDETLGFADDPKDIQKIVFLKGGPKLRSAEELAAAFPKQRYDLKCADCGAKLVLKDGKFGIFYGCVMFRETGCGGSHNCHKTTAEPLGIPANSETRKLRREAHDVFDVLWKSQGLDKMTRDAAYKWMQTNLKLTEQDAHIGKLDKEGCEKLIKAVDRFLHPPTRFEREDVI